MKSAAKSAPALNLYDARKHSNLRIRLISGNWEVRRSFSQLGLYVGDRVRVVRKAPFGGPLIVENRGSKVAIGRQLAENIRVEVLP
jgi:Fe2+ transport system protein FeoA